MPSHLSPVIGEQLAAFEKRWRRLLLLRGICEGVVTLLGAMTLAALLDWIFIMPEALRWSLSAAGYLGTALVVWFGCLRALLRSPSPQELARMLEKIRPELREDLISAVELAENKNDWQWDSPIFRKLLQDDVAKRVGNLEVNQLLPRKLISRWLYLAVGVVAVCAALLLIPELHYNQLMARALAPMANVDRVSSIKIKILEPGQTEGPAPRGDNLQFAVQISGPEPDKVYLETFLPDGSKERVSMNLENERRYRTTIAVETDVLEYRIRAGDAITRKFAIHTHARPHIVTFEKTFHFPAYSRLPDRKVKEENGDLTALEGSQVELLLHVDQQVKEGEMKLEVAGRQSSIPLQPAGPGLVMARVPIQAAGTYSVRLVAAETGFENKFSPQYEIRPQPDLIPSVRLDTPAADVIVQADEVINLQGMAKDDLALASVSQMTRLNNEPWEEFPLLKTTTNEVIVTRAWDLLSFKAKPGDQIVTKLVAVDLKGNRGESMPVRLVISSPGFDMKRLRALEAKQHFEAALKKLEKAANTLREAVAGRDSKNLKNGEELQRKQVVMAAQSALEEVEQEMSQGEVRLKDALTLAAPGRESADLALVGQVMSAIKNDGVARAKTELDKIDKSANNSGDSIAVRNANDAVNQAAWQSSIAQQAYQDILAAEQAGLISGNLNYLGQEQNRVNKQAATDANKDSQVWERLSRRQAGATQEVKLLEDLMKSLSRQIPQPLSDRNKKTTEGLQTSRTTLEKLMTNNPAGKDLLASSQNLQRGVEGALANFQPIEKELIQRAEKARDELSKQAKPSYTNIQKVRRDTEELADAERKLAEIQKKRTPTDKEKAHVQEQRDKLANDWKSATEQLKDRARVEESRHDADAQFVVDATKAEEALTALRAAAGGDQEAAKSTAPLKQLEKAFQTLEANHKLTDLQSGVKSLANQERWEAKDMDATTKRPKDWQWAQKALQNTAKEIQDAKLPEAAAKALNATKDSRAAKEVEQEMNARQSPQRTPVSVANNLDEVKNQLTQAEQQLAPAVEEARTAVTSAAPALSDMMKGLARASEKLENTTRAVAEKTKAADPETAREEARQTLNEQKELGKQLQDLKDALRRDANVQDIADKNGRERSRDADDAVAMLREPPMKAEDALREATQAKDSAQNQQALNAAAAQQRKTSDTLKQLAGHYQNLENGKPTDSRAALRAAEDDLGIKSGLDAEYNKADALAALSQKPPEELLAQLERELAQNEIMRKELATIADGSLGSAQQALQQSAGREQTIANNLNDVAKAQDTKNSLTEQANQLAKTARQLATQDVPAIRMDASASQANAGTELDRAAQALQSVADQTPKDVNNPNEGASHKLAELVRPLEQARNDLQAAANAAGEVVKKTNPTEPKAASALAAQTKAAKAAEQSQKLANQARDLANRLDNLSKSSTDQLAQAAKQQTPIANDVQQAGADIARAGRHESRLGTPQGQALENVGQQTQAIAEQKIPATQAALKPDQNAADAARAIGNVKQAVDNQLSALQSALSQPTTAAKAATPATAKPAPASESPSPSTAAAPAANANAATPAPAAASAKSAQAAFLDQVSQMTPPTPEESMWKARTLDQLDAALHPVDRKDETGQGQQQSGQQGQSGQQNQAGQQSASQAQAAKQAAANAMSDAAKAQKAAMMASRNKGNTPGQAPAQSSTEFADTGGEFSAPGGKDANGVLPEVRALRTGDWGKLPPKVAEGLMEARRENMPGEYRSMVETYFRVIAEKAREKK